MRTILLIAVAAAAAAGCAQPPTNVESNFGNAVLRARAAQVANPDAASARRGALGVDGEAANSAVKQYEQSMTKPAAPTGVLGITIGTGGSSPGSGSK